MKKFPDWFFNQSDWQEISFDDVIIPSARIGWQNLRKSEYLKNGYAYLIGGTDFKNGTVSTENIWQISKERYEMDKNIQVSAGDVLVTKDGTIGKVAIVPELYKPATLNSGVYIFRTNSKLLPRFLFYVLSSSIFKNFVDVLAAGTTINHLYQKDLHNFKFKIPPLAEQKQIAEYFTHLDNAINAQEIKLKSWREVKKAMLQKIFSQQYFVTQDNGDKFPAW